LPSCSRFLVAAFALAAAGAAFASGVGACHAESGPVSVPVIELYTSEGCSSCPPADKWLSTLKPAASRGEAVVQAFHVGYWDDIGWIDRFAMPAHGVRQRQVASRNGQANVYTPQLVRNGQDWRDYKTALQGSDSARAAIALRQGSSDAFSAVVTPAEPAGRWAAYWTVTEHGHSSKVKAGENAGEFLQHDFVVRQYVLAGEYRGPATLTLQAVPGQPGHPRRVNLVVFDPRSGKTLQALSLGCA
jgi:hypothetical protein